MTRVHNFNAGPSTLPLPVLEDAAKEFVDYDGKGLAIIEASHRSAEYSAVHEKACQIVRDLLSLPDNYKVIFLAGGATMQFSMVPLNLLGTGEYCDFTLTGYWANKAYMDASKIGKVNVVFDGKSDDYLSLPNPGQLKVNPNAAYVHLTSNETIGGVQWKLWPETNGVPIVCDMSSDIMTRSLPIEKFGLIYAGAQKNLGPAGATLVIIRDDLLETCPNDMPTYLSYRVHAEKNSLYNTPPVFSIYMISKVLSHVKNRGGLSSMEKLAEIRSSIIYDVIDEYSNFYCSRIPKQFRSKINVVWWFPNEKLEKKFIDKAKAKEMIGLKGHSSVGGCRASMYNALPVESTLKLAEFMKTFAQRNG